VSEGRSGGRKLMKEGRRRGRNRGGVGGKKEAVRSFVGVLCGFKLWSIA
jgi:hypothetical protein